MTKQATETKTNKLAQFEFLFAHGAGADMDSEWMLLMDKKLSEKGITVKRFDFPYMEQRKIDGKRRPPDRQAKLIATFLKEIENIPKNKKLIIGGKSMGGRMASLLLNEPCLKRKIYAVVCMGFPFHPPKTLDKFRGEHLATIQTPILILQGERDTFGNQQELQAYQFSPCVQIEILADGDHSFKPRVKSGLTLDDNLDVASEKVIQFLSAI